MIFIDFVFLLKRSRTSLVKSIEGSLGFLGTSFISTILFLNYFNFDYSLEKIFIISLICSLVESLPKIDDNLSVPFVALLLCNFYL